MSTLENVPGGLTESTPGQTDRVAQALSKAQAIPAVALDVPVVEAEVIPELDADAARVLDTEIRRLSAQISGQLHQVRVLLDEAQTGMIHKVLGFPSWTAYVADALSGIRLALSGDDRRDMVQLLAEAGMSVRAIETATGIPKSTVARDDFRQIAENYYRRNEIVVGEDVEISNRQAAGLNSPYARMPRLCKAEVRLNEIHNWLLDRIIGPAAAA